MKAKAKTEKPMARGERMAWIIVAGIIGAIIAVAFLTSCTTVRVMAQSPAVITGKAYIYTDHGRNAQYTFVDASGRQFVYYDASTLHEVGDTLRLPY